jgi:hypothetical protein
MTIVKGDKTIHTEKQWVVYYLFLERLRRSGVCNMWGATPYIMEAFHLNDEDAGAVLCNWIHNYAELYKIYNWGELNNEL